jgi:hypothetical protein
MKKLLMIALLISQSFTAQAMVLPEGSPRPLERSLLTIQNASGAYSNVHGAALTRVKLEMTNREAFILDLSYRGFNPLRYSFAVTGKRRGPCGEIVYTGEMISKNDLNVQVKPLIMVTDHRSNRCPTLVVLPAWYVVVQNGMMANDFINMIGQPEPIFTVMGNRNF